MGRDYGCGYRHRDTHRHDPVEEIIRSPHVYIDDDDDDEDYTTWGGLAYMEEEDDD